MRLSTLAGIEIWDQCERTYRNSRETILRWKLGVATFSKWLQVDLAQHSGCVFVSAMPFFRDLQNSDHLQSWNKNAGDQKTGASKSNDAKWQESNTSSQNLHSDTDSSQKKKKKCIQPTYLSSKCRRKTCHLFAPVTIGEASDAQAMSKPCNPGAGDIKAGGREV